MQTINKAIEHCKATTRSSVTRRKTPEARLVLPFIDDQLVRAVQAVVRKSDHRDMGVTWTNRNTIKRQLVRSALKPSPCPGGSRCHSYAAGLLGKCQNAGVVYQVICELCNQTYIGETGRPVRLRYNEHFRDAINARGDSPWGDHFRERHPQCRPEPSHMKVKIMQFCDDHRDRKIAESLWIRQLRPALNTNIASWAIL